MSFLAKLFQWFGPTLLNWLKDVILEAYGKWQARRQAEKEIRDRAKKNTDQTEKAESKEDRENAADDTFKNF